MIAQVKEELRLDGRLMENVQTVFKVVYVDYDGRYRSAMMPKLSGYFDVFQPPIYVPNTYYRVGENFDYPAFAFHEEVNARDFIHIIDEYNTMPLAILSCVAYQWAWLSHYMALTYVAEPESMELFWSTTLPFRQDGVPYAAHKTPPGTIGLFEFEIGDKIYGG